ncbi:hypothetical protein [Paenibacillus turpanensis]|uniref:hypothetical protein n=1 Tax=Paenibacillus turpanensis TaxID=2689078 RepID=UPI00140C9C25|nr:hypothetical protein [Paenibacillus turpanensis]
MYNQQFQRPIQSPIQSQYRGYQRQYQPVGYVQSSYQGGFQPTSFQTAGFQQQFQPQFTQYGHPTNPEAYHTASYVGNVPDHDRAFREDSFQPAGYGYQGAQYGQYQQFQGGASTTAHVQNIRPSAFPTARF